MCKANEQFFSIFAYDFDPLLVVNYKILVISWAARVHLGSVVDLAMSNFKGQDFFVAPGLSLSATFATDRQNENVAPRFLE